MPRDLPLYITATVGGKIVRGVGCLISSCIYKALKASVWS